MSESAEISSLKVLLLVSKQNLFLNNILFFFISGFYPVRTQRCFDIRGFNVINVVWTLKQRRSLTW